MADIGTFRICYISRDKTVSSDPERQSQVIALNILYIQTNLYQEVALGKKKTHSDETDYPLKEVQFIHNVL